MEGVEPPNIFYEFCAPGRIRTADHMVRSSACSRYWNYLDCKGLIFNNHARGMSVAYSQPSMTEHNEVPQATDDALRKMLVSLVTGVPCRDYYS